MRCFAVFASVPRLSSASTLTIPAFTAMALAASAVASPALAQDHEYGAYLFKGACSMFSPDLVIKDIGDLEIEKDATKEWARVSPDKAKMPNPVYVEGESTDKVNAKQLAEGGHAIAITETNSPDAKMIACGELPKGLSLPFVGEIHAVDGSNITGRVAVEEHKKGVKITTAAFAKDSVPQLKR